MIKFPDLNFLTPQQISELFQIEVRTIHDLARKGKIPAIKVGRLWRFRQEDIWRWIQSQYAGADFSEIHLKAREILGIDSNGAI